MKSKIIEFFGSSTSSQQDWNAIVSEQKCPYISKKCYKVRKSGPNISIGTCTVEYGKDPEPLVICPSRFLERHQIFTDCIHLLTLHEPGNELHVVSEVSIPGGSVDYFLISAKNEKVVDFVGIEIQTLDTTGTVWPERQRLLKALNLKRLDDAESSTRPYGMNWKMTAKTILVQIHHKIHTFEHLNKKLVLIVQDKLLEYMIKEFSFGHLSASASLGESMHFHAYKLNSTLSKEHKLALDSRFSTDSEGIAKCLGLQAESKVELDLIIKTLQAKISLKTLLIPV
ncbi:MAG: NotI family restriction endonuclease [Vampirovibrionales bacterium]|nr:NotI family restriction endonuclease [Vampirovibrionales bacterium]